MMRVWPTSKEECKKVTQRLLVSVRTPKALCGSRIDWLCQKKEALKKKILDEAHTSRYSIHPDSTKMYHDLRE
jgi:hypothetical protein